MTPAGAGTKQPLEWETAIFRETSSGKRASRQHSRGWLAFDALLLISRLKMYLLPEWENRAITSVSEDARSPCLNFNYTTKKKKVEKSYKTQCTIVEIRWENTCCSLTARRQPCLMCCFTILQQLTPPIIKNSIVLWEISSGIIKWWS